MGQYTCDVQENCPIFTSSLTLDVLFQTKPPLFQVITNQLKGNIMLG